MGIGSRIFVFLRLSQRGGKTRIGRPGTKEKEIGFERYPSSRLFLGKSYNVWGVVVVLIAETELRCVRL